MKFTEIITLSAALATSASAGPLRRSTAPDSADITFVAADASFSQSFPTDGTVVEITNPLSIDSISSSTNGITCTFTGIDNGETTISNSGSVTVGPPQTQVSGHCSKLWRRNAQPQRRDLVPVTFQGAADAEFDQYFPTDGTSTKIYNPLSISHIQIDQAGVTCTFKGVDDSVTTLTGPATVDVGPPQTQIEGTCTA